MKQNVYNYVSERTPMKHIEHFSHKWTSTKVRFLHRDQCKTCDTPMFESMKNMNQKSFCLGQRKCHMVRLSTYLSQNYG